MLDADILFLLMFVLVALHLAAIVFARYVLKRDVQEEQWLKASGCLVIVFGIFFVAAAAMDPNPVSGPSFRNWPGGLLTILAFLGGYLWFVRHISPTAFAVGEIALGGASALAVSADTTMDQLAVTVTYLFAVYMVAQGLHTLNHQSDGLLTNWLKPPARP
ncbi:MAG: hypothetical protein BGO02_12220 [Brevundimonas sp. 67-6]|nr:MAG: hypothetical protein BGO02_12220 [Brevundimonas sp. 67-6]